MDSRIVLFISLSFAISTALGQTPDPDGQRCTNSEMCPDGMCCVHNPLNKPDPVKRFIFQQYSQHDHGYCRRARRYNESCVPLGHDAANPALYDYYCPCTSGLECRGLIVHETEHQIIHRYPKCQYPESVVQRSCLAATDITSQELVSVFALTTVDKLGTSFRNVISVVAKQGRSTTFSTHKDIINEGPTASGPHCVTDTDCGAGMCCVIHPMTSTVKKTLYLSIHQGHGSRRATHGYCRALSKINETCDLIDINTNDFQCPCQSGLECRGMVVHHFGNQTVHENTICQAPQSG